MFTIYGTVIFVILIIFNNRASSQSDQCGIEYKSEGRVRGGEPSKRFESPWKIAILRNDNDNEQFEYSCGGVLIDEDTVVTGKKFKI